MFIQSANRHILLLFVLGTILLPMPAWTSTAVMIGQYRIQVFTDPDPVIAGKEATIILKVVRLQDFSSVRPVRNGQIFLSTGTLGSISASGLNLNDLSGYKQTQAKDEFGNYELKTTFPNPDTYYIRAAIKGIDAITTHAPLTAGFTLTVNPQDHSFLRLLLIFFLLLSITCAGVYLIHVKFKMRTAVTEELNFLDIAWIKRIFQSKYTQPVFQVSLLIFFMILLLLTFIDIQDSGKNLSVIVIWTVWWAGIIFTFVLVGRLWCSCAR